MTERKYLRVLKREAKRKAREEREEQFEKEMKDSRLEHKYIKMVVNKISSYILNRDEDDHEPNRILLSTTIFDAGVLGATDRPEYCSSIIINKLKRKFPFVTFTAIADGEYFPEFWITWEYSKG